MRTVIGQSRDMRRTLTRAWRAERGARSGTAPRGAACRWGSACGRWGTCGGGLQDQKKKKKRELDEGRRLQKNRALPFKTKKAADFKARESYNKAA